MKLLVLNGPNLNLLGLREPDIYGNRSYAALEEFIRAAAREAGCEVEIRQTNHEGVLVDWIQEAYGMFDGIVINPARSEERRVGKECRSRWSPYH